MEQKGLLGSEAHEYRAQDVDPSALRTVLASLDRGLIVRALHALRIRSARLELCLSGKDAAATAISFAALKTVSQALLQARLWPKDATLRLRADFSAEHSALDFEGIVSVRMGSLLLVAGAFGARLLALKKYRAPKERLYAASH